MLTVSKIIPAGRGLAKALLRDAATLELDWDVRQKSRFEAVDSAGDSLGVFLARGTVVRGGDVLVAEDGSLRLVRAVPQAVLVVHACAEHGTPFDLLRAAYHLGNRHVQLELRPDCLLLEVDPVLAALLRRMHLIVTEAQEPFEPEGGAYASAPGAAAHAGHAHAHAAGHAQSRVSGHAHSDGGHTHSADGPAHSDDDGHPRADDDGQAPSPGDRLAPDRR